ncbi:hypothetical protein CUMW_236280 [Citrus unshiu]|nr:hypothetical protein CUMW_236280 [Citrus unshiu]
MMSRIKVHLQVKAIKDYMRSLTTSWHAQLSLNLVMLGSLTIVLIILFHTPYPYLAIWTMVHNCHCFTHHMWIVGFLIVGVAAHAAIFMVRDYDPTTRYNDLLRSCPFGIAMQSYHISTGYGVHKICFQIPRYKLQPHPARNGPGATASTSLTWGGVDLVAVGGKVALLPIPLGTADFLVHHIHAFTIHVTVLILLKGVLFARSSRLIPDKANLGFRFPCVVLRRGGHVSIRLDHVFLGLFWMYNAISVYIIQECERI